MVDGAYLMVKLRCLHLSRSQVNEETLVHVRYVAVVRHQHDPIVFSQRHRQQGLDAKVHTSVVYLEDIEV